MKRKLYKCERCGREVPVRSKGLCPACRSKETGGIKKKPMLASRKNPGLPDFFKMMIEKLSETCMSCTGKPIPNPSSLNICHILPKRKYSSVATEGENIIFLTAEEHERFDYLLDSFQFDALDSELSVAWGRAVRQVIEMEKEGKIKERGKLIISILERYEK